MPAEQIIVFAYDDIAHNIRNRIKGKIFNKPSTGMGVDVYKGCEIDYSKRDVKPKIFKAVMEGNAAAIEAMYRKEGRLDEIDAIKVLKSTKTSHVFVNFVDHGAPGLIAFPS